MINCLIAFRICQQSAQRSVLLSVNQTAQSTRLLKNLEQLHEHLLLLVKYSAHIAQGQSLDLLVARNGLGEVLQQITSHSVDIQLQLLQGAHVQVRVRVVGVRKHRELRCFRRSHIDNRAVVKQRAESAIQRLAYGRLQAAGVLRR